MSAAGIPAVSRCARIACAAWVQLPMERVVLISTKLPVKSTERRVAGRRSLRRARGGGKSRRRAAAREGVVSLKRAFDDSIMQDAGCQNGWYGLEVGRGL